MWYAALSPSQRTGRPGVGETPQEGDALNFFQGFFHERLRQAP